MLDAVHNGHIMAACDDLVDTHFVLDQTFENIVQHRIGRQRILIGLIRSELRRRGLVDDVDRDHFTRRPQRAGRHVAIAPA